EGDRLGPAVGSIADLQDQGVFP
ncbi:hypothetical protein LCGC14_2799020, partial [marine sediment metagenome]